MAYNNHNNNNPADEWNINQGWLDIIRFLMMKFTDSDFQNDYEDMYKSLVHLESNISPKIDNDNIEKNLKIIRNKMDMMEKRDSDGNIICTYPAAQRAVQRLFHDTYALILKKMDDQGILTKLSSDPRKAMGNFSGS